MRGKQFPPRGPRSTHIKIDVTVEERKSLEKLATHYGCTVVEALKTAAWRELQRMADFSHESTRPDVPGFDSVWNDSQYKWQLVKRSDHVPAVAREAET